MTGLVEAYEGARGPARIRVTAGVALFGSGLLAVAVAIFLGTIDPQPLETIASRHYAGAIAGLGVPAALLGVLLVVPANRRVYAAAIIGATVAVLGVSLFWETFRSPLWAGFGDNPSYRFEVATVYAAGVLLTAAAMFVGLATTTDRRRPGGSARLTVTEKGRIKLVDAAPSVRKHLTGTTVSDGGSITEPVVGELNDAVVLGDDGDATNGDGSDGSDDANPDIDPADRYCGNCRYFEYERTSAGLQPYCGLNEERMDDVEACEEWERNRSEAVQLN